jgi:hypothetical protein
MSIVMAPECGADGWLSEDAAALSERYCGALERGDIVFFGESP